MEILQNELAVTKVRLSKLEERIEQNDLYERRDTLVFSGSKIPGIPTSLGSTAVENILQVTRNLIRENLKISVPENEISTAHRIVSKNPNQRSIIVKFCRRDRKIEILTAARQSKVQQFFVNEHLTATQKAIGFVLRKAKREFPDVVSGSTTFVGIIRLL